MRGKGPGVLTPPQPFCFTSINVMHPCRANANHHTVTRGAVWIPAIRISRPNVRAGIRA